MVQLVKEDRNTVGDWVEDNRRVFSTVFRYGLNQTYVQMIRLHRSEHYEVNLIDSIVNQQQFLLFHLLFYDFCFKQILNVEAINVDTDDWVFGCVANEIDKNQRYW